MIRTQTVRLYPTKAQEATLNEWFYQCRRAWNQFLEQRIKAYKRRKESVKYEQQTAYLTKWRQRDNRMMAVPFAFTRDAARRLDKAFKSFFRRVNAGETPGFPRFKSANRFRSIEYNRNGNYVHDGKIRVPCLGLIKARNLRDLEGTIKSLRILRKADKWIAQLVIDDGKKSPPKRPIKTTVGIDVGLNSFAVLSNGDKIDNPRYYRNAQVRLASAQRQLSRKTKGSKRRRRAVRRAARLHERVANCRKNFAHHLSKELVSRFDLIAIEDLNVLGLSRGMLAKSVHDAAWSHFRHCVTYKAENAGVTLIAVDPRGTSQTCSCCGAVVRKELSVREHECHACGLIMDRDENAAINVLKRAIASVGGEFTRVEWPTPGQVESPARCATLKREVQLPLWGS